VKTEEFNLRGNDTQASISRSRRRLRAFIVTR
jgi:hypothetical protein